jgi:hypothetical protein
MAYYSVYYHLDPTWYEEHGDQTPAGLGLLRQHYATPRRFSLRDTAVDAASAREEMVELLTPYWPSIPQSAWRTEDYQPARTGGRTPVDPFAQISRPSVSVWIDEEWLREHGDQPYYTDGMHLAAYREQQVLNPSPRTAEEADTVDLEWLREAALEELLEQWPTVPSAAWIIDGTNVEYDTDEFYAIDEDYGDEQLAEDIPYEGDEF